MLDFAHRLALQAIESGTEKKPDSEAMQNLIACGLVEQSERRLVLTSAGREALRRSEPDRRERWLILVLSVAVIILGIGTVIDWVA